MDFRKLFWLVVLVWLTVLTTVTVYNYYKLNLVSDSTLIKDMKKTCEQSYKVVDGNLEYQCQQYIDKLEDRGYEVLYKNGSFWAESKN